MSKKIGPILFCLIFAVCFGGVGVGATWMMASTIYDGERAKDWVLVKAEVVKHQHPRVVYRYTVDDKTYTGTRLGAEKLGGTDNIDDWHNQMDDMLSTALKENRPIMVYVNPDNPAESMIDRTIRWKLILFMSPFMLAFGGVGLGAIWGITKIARGETSNAPKKILGVASESTGRASSHAGERRSPQRIKSDAGASLLGIWFFAFLWNAISFPIAMLMVPQMVQEKQWLGLFVLLFPLIGVLLLYAAIKGTIYFMRRGGVSLSLTDDSPRVGGTLQGFVAFRRGVDAGDTFKIRLVCIQATTRTSGNSSETTDSPLWSKEIDSRASDVGGEARLQFRFEVPNNLKPTENEGASRIRWRIEARPPGSRVDMPYGFQVELAPSLMPSEAPAHDEEDTRDAPELPDVEQMLSGMGMGMDEAKRQQFNRLTDQQRQMALKAAKYAPTVRYVVIGIVVLVVASQFIGTIASVLAMVFK